MTPTSFWALLAVTLAVGVAVSLGRFRAAGSATPPDASCALVMQDDLREALSRDQLVLHYQPKIELGTGRVSALEALVRWRHPERGLLPPAEFLSSAAKERRADAVPDELGASTRACRLHGMDGGRPRLDGRGQHLRRRPLVAGLRRHRWPDPGGGRCATRPAPPRGDRDGVG